jgi:hypothetical protein
VCVVFCCDGDGNQADEEKSKNDTDDFPFSHVVFLSEPFISKGSLFIRLLFEKG